MRTEDYFIYPYSNYMVTPIGEAIDMYGIDAILDYMIAIASSEMHRRIDEIIRVHNTMRFYNETGVFIFAAHEGRFRI